MMISVPFRVIGSLGVLGKARNPKRVGKAVLQGFHKVSGLPFLGFRAFVPVWPSAAVSRHKRKNGALMCSRLQRGARRCSRGFRV